jgi:ubiquinone/menaquinone biosynthesis C-methylase UbiE
MSDVREHWRRERLIAGAYDRAVQSERLAQVLGPIVWRTDTKRLFTRIAELGALPAGTAVLDVPCGGGLAFRGVRREQQLRYVAADISPYMLERARACALRTGLDTIELVEADALALPFDDASFDVCVTLNALHCLPAQRPALVEMRRVLRPGGELRGSAIVDGAGWRQDALIRFYRRIALFGETSTAADLEVWLGDAGFADVTVETSGAMAHFSARLPANAE